jgi:HlyD family secretion protein
MEDYNMKKIAFINLLMASTLLLSCSSNNSIPSGSGLIEATEVTISSEVSGQLKAIYFDEGNQAATGDTLVHIDTTIISLQIRRSQAVHKAAKTGLANSEMVIEQAKLNLNFAEKEFNRSKSLIKTGSVNQQQYDRSETEYNRTLLAEKQARAARDAVRAELDRIEADIALLQEQLDNCFPKSPTRGIVADKFVQAGELVRIGTPLLKLAQIDTVWVKVYLPPSDLTRFKIGDEAQIDPEDNQDKPLTGHISWISPEAEFTPKNVQTKEARANLFYAVKITIPNPDERLKVGMPVFVEIP